VSGFGFKIETLDFLGETTKCVFIRSPYFQLVLNMFSPPGCQHANSQQFRYQHGDESPVDAMLIALDQLGTFHAISPTSSCTLARPCAILRISIRSSFGQLVVRLDFWITKEKLVHLKLYIPLVRLHNLIQNSVCQSFILNLIGGIGNIWGNVRVADICLVLAGCCC
jgi:hypothetical protein